MWETFNEPEYTSYRFILNEEEIAYIEKGCELSIKAGRQSFHYFGFCLSKERDHFHLEGSDLDIVKFKALVKLKEFGWDIKEWPS